MATNLNISEQDFDTIKSNLITFLQSQSEFNTYDFTGSSMNVLLDVMSYVTHYNAVTANMVLNESFLDSAIIRSSVVSKAKELGYFPSQPTGALSQIDITLNNPGDVLSDFIIPAKTNFNGSNENNTLKFTTLVDTVLRKPIGISGVLTGTINVIQGFWNTQSFTYNTNGKFILSNTGVEVSNLSVKVYVDINDTNPTLWSYEGTFTEIKSTDKVFFLAEDNNHISIYFGNGTLGLEPTVGYIIKVDYLITAGSSGNGISSITLNSDVTDLNGYTAAKSLFSYSNTVKSYDGTDIETIDSIKFLAPYNYQAQNRIVTIQDYKTAILKNYLNIDSLNVWGGENSVPPDYGKVFLSIKPKTGETISPSTKNSIIDTILKNYSVIGISPEFKDVSYIKLNIDTEVKYDSSQTSLNGVSIANKVNTSVKAFFVSNLYQFDSIFKYSRLLNSIDTSDGSIINNLTSITLSRLFVPVYNGKSTMKLEFSNPINTNSIISDIWINKSSNNLQLKDDGLGFIDLYVDGIIFSKKVGSVNYSAGVIEFINFDFELNDIAETVLLTITPTTYDITVAFNNLLSEGLINITTTAITK